MIVTAPTVPCRIVLPGGAEVELQNPAEYPLNVKVRARPPARALCVCMLCVCVLCLCESMGWMVQAVNKLCVCACVCVRVTVWVEPGRAPQYRACSAQRGP